MDDTLIWQLYPLPGREVELNGLYLAHDLRQEATAREGVFIYTNYVTSLDGRIAVARPSGSGMMVPPGTANDRDWRLFQELAVQADVIISSGRYLRDYAEGKTQEILRVYDDPRFVDLGHWRTSRNLSRYPDLAIISGSLDFPIPPFLLQSDRRVIVLTSEKSDPVHRRALAEQGATIRIAGDATVSGRGVAAALGGLGYRTIYMATGPRVHHLLLADDVLDGLYMTHAHRLLGGHPFSSLVEGSLLNPGVGMQLHTLYFDPHALDGLGQLFLGYRRR